MLYAQILKATLTCPNCGKSKQQDVSNFFNPETPVRIKSKCCCQYSFSVRLERRRAIKKVELIPGSINQYKCAIKRRKNHTAVLIAIFFLIIAILTATFYLILDNSEPSKLLLETSHREEIKSVYNNGKEIKFINDSSE